MSRHLPPKAKLPRMPDLSTNQIVSHDYLATFTRFQFRTRIIESLNLFDFASTFTQKTAQSFTEKIRELQ